MFFEKTIGSLEDDDERIRKSARERPAAASRHPSRVDHDIIDLVHPTPDPSKQRDTLPVMPGIRKTSSQYKPLKTFQFILNMQKAVL